MVSQEMGSAAGPLLRPSCEEFIWTRYLLTIPNATAEQLVSCITNCEIHTRLSAQRKAVGQDGMDQLGLTPYLQRSRESRSKVLDKLRQIGQTLQWPDTKTNNSELPSVSWLAKKTGNQDIYELVYSATSRFVHFSPSELYRRAWGHPGAISIRSNTFQPYWNHFCLHWGLTLFLRTVAEISSYPGMPDLYIVDDQTVTEAAINIGRFGSPPIITAEELAWPF